MKYVGIQTQQKRNNFRSLLLLCLFPCLVVGLAFVFCYLLAAMGGEPQPDRAGFGMDSGWQPDMPVAGMEREVMPAAVGLFLHVLPFVVGGVLVWFLIAYFSNTRIIASATGARPLARSENKRVYNLVENLCIAQGMKMPAVHIIDDDSLNAFASGINERTYTVTLSKGIIEKLDDSELEAVIAHELSHIRNHDVRLLIISIVFVGIFAMIAQIAMRTLYYSSFTSSSRNRDEKGGGNGVIVIVLLAMAVAAIGYFFSVLMRFAISRKREYLADAGSAEMTRNPLALAAALRKISADPAIEAVRREDVAQLFIEHPGDQAKSALSGLSGLFATHPPIEKRIQVLEQF